MRSPSFGKGTLFGEGHGEPFARSAIAPDPLFLRLRGISESNSCSGRYHHSWEEKRLSEWCRGAPFDGFGKLARKKSRPGVGSEAIDDAGDPDIPQTGDASSKRMLPLHASYSGLQKQTSWGISMSFQSALTAEQHLLLELIADMPLAAMPDIAQYTRTLAAARLIELTPAGKWRITGLGQAVLHRHEHWLH